VERVSSPSSLLRGLRVSVVKTLFIHRCTPMDADEDHLRQSPYGIRSLTLLLSASSVESV